MNKIEIFTFGFFNFEEGQLNLRVDLAAEYIEKKCSVYVFAFVCFFDHGAACTGKHFEPATSLYT